MGWGDVCTCREGTFALRCKTAAARHTGVPGGPPWLPMASLGSGNAQALALLWSLPALPCWPSLHVRLPTPWPPISLVAVMPPQRACPGFTCDTPGLQQKG